MMVKMVTILIGDCLDVLKTLPDCSVHCCVTSPPYWGLRDYGVEGQFGMERMNVQRLENNDKGKRRGCFASA